MLFWTVVLFIGYSMLYFVVSQRKMQKLRKSNAELSERLQQHNIVFQQARSGRARFEMS